MRRLLLIFFWTALIGQKSPTVPKNVFRFSIEKNYSVSKWDLDKQNFDLQGIGRHYFDNMLVSLLIKLSSLKSLLLKTRIVLFLSKRRTILVLYPGLLPE